MDIDEAIKLCEKCISGVATYDKVTQYFDEIETPERIVALLRFVQAWRATLRARGYDAISKATEDLLAANDDVDEALK